MEHRMKYRDIPWGVALTVLPGKIIGQFILNPAHNIGLHWKRMLIKIGKVLGVTLLSLIILFLILILIESLTEGKLTAFFIETYKNATELL